MPFAPRLLRTVIARSVDGNQPSRSRTGIELPAHSTAPSGSASASTGNGSPSNDSSSDASHEVIVRTAVRSASIQSRVHVPYRTR